MICIWVVILLCVVSIGYGINCLLGNRFIFVQFFHFLMFFMFFDVFWGGYEFRCIGICKID